MNKGCLVGRFTKDPAVSKAGETTIARFTVAVDRRKTSTNGGTNADFISCVAFGKTAEFIEKYFHKGQRIGMTGRIQTGSYKNKDGNTVYTTDVVVEEAEFVESKSGGGNTSNTAKPASDSQFVNVPDSVDDEELPFN